jgi:hypothetical protein
MHERNNDSGLAVPRRYPVVLPAGSDRHGGGRTSAPPDSTMTDSTMTEPARGCTARANRGPRRRVGRRCDGRPPADRSQPPSLAASLTAWSGYADRGRARTWRGNPRLGAALSRRCTAELGERDSHNDGTSLNPTRWTSSEKDLAAPSLPGLFRTARDPAGNAGRVGRSGRRRSPCRRHRPGGRRSVTGRRIAFRRAARHSRRSPAEPPTLSTDRARAARATPGGPGRPAIPGSASARRAGRLRG